MLDAGSTGMTICWCLHSQTQLRDLRRMICARFQVNVHAPSKQRAQGRPGARCTRGLVCKMHKEMRTRAYRFSGDNPAFPAQWFYGLFVLSPVTGFLATVAPAGALLSRLDASVGAPGPHDFAVRLRAVRQRHIRVHRIPPRFRDDRERPSCRVGTGRACSGDLPDGEGEYFLHEGGQGFGDLPSGCFVAPHASTSSLRANGWAR